MKVSILAALLLYVFFIPEARAQYISVAGGGLFQHGFSQPAPPEFFAVPIRAGFSNGPIVAVDAGTRFLRFLGINAHYSYSDSDFHRRDTFDASGSFALLDLNAHTLALDARISPPISDSSIKPYGFVGGGFTHFGIKVKQLVEIPLREQPGDVTSPVFTFGGGLKTPSLPVIGGKISGKIEVRDYVSTIPESFYAPRGRWHRVAVVAGIVFGK